ncbi:MAG TPA: GNAT family N-acetyltransferase [Phenylobacterium sp.]|nr:GNAT family N-acetyltransferase [Phenylobacterium sp.]
MTLRRATPADAEAIARVNQHARWFQPSLADEVDPGALAYFAEEVLPQNEVWVSETAAGVIGVIAFTPEWVNHLYVLPDHQGQGLGGVLLDIAKAQSRDLQLWTFVGNTKARRFYEARGFVLEEETDGSRNMEREPDVRYRWRA